MQRREIERLRAENERLLGELANKKSSDEHAAPANVGANIPALTNKPANRNEYQRNLMRERRKAEKAAREGKA